MGCHVKNDWSNVRKISDPDKHMFFEQGVRGGVILIKDIAKHLKISIFSILTWIIYMGVLWDNISVLVILSGSKR